nr:MAG TPA: hypothetical protein [Bacteriophage sp.]
MSLNHLIFKASLFNFLLYSMLTERLKDYSSVIFDKQ